MLTLAIDCATQTIGIALLDNREVCAELSLKLGRHHAEVLLPALGQVCELAGLAPGKVDLLACTIGPGSFTGLRIGVSTVKGLALGLQKPVVGVSTLEALAMNGIAGAGLVCPLLDARKNQVYTGFYRRGPVGLPEREGPERLTDLERLLKEIPPGEIVFLGDGAMRHEQRLTQAFGSRAVLPGLHRQRILASAVGLIGRHRYSQGERLNTLTFAPRYLRLSEAETRLESG
jgi:tRNA threonylcarbamoyladenosine biosynthesis protein TsaB